MMQVMATRRRWWRRRLVRRRGDVRGARRRRARRARRGRRGARGGARLALPGAARGEGTLTARTSRQG